MNFQRFLIILALAHAASAFICPYKLCLATEEKSLQKCFDSAAPGTIINVNPAYNYRGKFKIEGRKGTQNCPIFFNGNGMLILGTDKEDKDTCFTMKMAEYWIMNDMEIRNCKEGMLMEECSFNSISKFEIHDSERIGLTVKGGTKNVLSAFNIHDLGTWEWPWGKGAVFDKDKSTQAQGFKMGPKILDNAIEVKEASMQGQMSGIQLDGVDKVANANGMGWSVAGAAGKSSNGQGLSGGISVGGLGNVAMGNMIQLEDPTKTDVASAGGSVQVDSGSGNMNCASSQFVGSSESDDNLEMPC
eukprot:TRINITY_DN17240_c1_g1_i5.p1 TRINITY_DN17240_c1_g1~~TRINITY_DN17240_c1_g1_i5.p1  ORF type:complete len:302 (+),score=57.66 TRINITY_DN17240_c1_g1_i5:89-994(+)